MFAFQMISGRDKTVAFSRLFCQNLISVGFIPTFYGKWVFYDENNEEGGLSSQKSSKIEINRTMRTFGFLRADKF
jgi:hypothetical protein